MDVGPRNTPSEADLDSFISFQKTFKYHKSSSEIGLIISTFGLLKRYKKIFFHESSYQLMQVGEGVSKNP